MNRNFHDKLQNTKLLHESVQIRSAILNFNEQLKNSGEEDVIIIVHRFYLLYTFSRPRLRIVYGNNLVNTDILKLLNDNLQKFILKKVSSSSNTFKCSYLLLSVIWNSTDCSENFCEALCEYPKMINSLTDVYCKLDFKDENECQIANSIISIIHNAIRRPKLKDKFKNIPLLEKNIVNMFEIIEESSIKLVCLVALLEIAKEESIQSYSALYDTVKDSVIGFLDGTSNDEDYRYEGFSAREVLDMVISLMKVQTVMKTFKESRTLEMALLRLLVKNHCDSIVASIMRRLYPRSKLQKLMEVYKNKTPNYNSTIYDNLTS